MKKYTLHNALMVSAIIAVFLAAVFLIFLLTKNTTRQSSERLTITTSFYPLYFFTSQIVGEHATVYNITPAGAEPHEYEPTSRDVARIEDSEILILNGGQLETWGEREASALEGTHTTVVIVGDDLAKLALKDEGETTQDPHIWLDPTLAKKMVASIADAVVKVDPANAESYRTNAAALEAKLDALDESFVGGLVGCPKKDIITSHAAFGYLAARYGLTQVAISGISPDEEPSAQTLAEAADFAQKNDVQYIFFESLVSPKFAETIANEVGAQTLELNPIEGLPDDEVSAGATYFTAMNENLYNLQIALECQ